MFVTVRISAYQRAFSNFLFYFWAPDSDFFLKNVNKCPLAYQSFFLLHFLTQKLGIFWRFFWTNIS